MSNCVVTDEFKALPRVLVLMATYNGEKYLREQIDSILNQKDVEVALFICDDCSTDGSFAIAQEYAQSDPRVFSRRNPTNVGVGMNFLNMVYDVEPNQYDYIAFSDQDDVWLDDKILIACEAISEEVHKTEAKRVEPFGVPVLYCSDLQNVDKNMLNPVHELRALNIDCARRTIPLIRNYYSGCTMVMNNSMLCLFQSQRLDQIFRIHDVWLALVARYCGNLIVDLDHARILRRITGNNTAGAILAGGDFAQASFAHLRNKPQNSFSKTAAQLYERFGCYMNESDAKMIKSFSIHRTSFFRKMYWALRPDFCGTTLKESIYQKVKLLLGRY